MTTPTIVQKQIDAINRHDAKELAGLYSPNATVVDPQHDEPLRGSEAIERDMADFFTAFPDLEVKLEKTIVEGDLCAYEVTMEGTHKGPLPGPAGRIPATNKRIRTGLSVHSRLDADSRVVEEKRFYDQVAIFSQLGVMQG